MKKFIRITLLAVLSLAGFLLAVLIVSAAVYSPSYMARILVNGESKITDYRLFPEREIARGERVYTYQTLPDEALPQAEIRYLSGGEQRTETLEQLLEENGTTSCLVIKDDVLVYEAYFNGYARDSVETSFSSVKSLDSLLIGLAIEDGAIHSVQDRISDYIPEFTGTPFEGITIEQLLLMRSPIDYREGLAWFSDDAKTYYAPDLRNLALNQMRIDPAYAGQFHYNNYHPLLLGIILERATGMHVADYFRWKIWSRIGAEFDASWSLDSKQSGFEKMESGLNFRSIDYAKIGSMLLHDGAWNGEQIVPARWLEASVIAPEPLSNEDVSGGFFPDIPIGYRYMWYSTENAQGGHDFFSAGKYGQYIYVSPENDVVIVRTGFDVGEVDWWPGVLAQIAQSAQNGATTAQEGNNG
jgi:CubicO group peptidase (beta-lactamase class C family)